MANAKKILSNFAKTAEPQTEDHIVIGKDRVIKVPEDLREIAVQFDHNVETVTFDCPRYWDNNDMSAMTVYVNYMRADGETGSCMCTNITPDQTDDKLMHFDWTIKRHATEVIGSLKFLVCIKKEGSDGTYLNHWNSKLNDELSIAEGLEVDGINDRPPEDIIAQLIELIESKLDKNQGENNAGKALIVGHDGNIVPGDVQGGGSSVEYITTSDIDEIMNGQGIGEENKVLNENGLKYLVEKEDGRYVKKEEGKGLSENDFTDEYKQKIDDLMYVKIAINSLTATNNNNEIGSTVTASDITWALNKEPSTQSIKFGSEASETLDKTVRKKTYTGKSIKSNTNITLTVSDERNATVSKSVGISFMPKVYWGKTSKSSLTSEDILELEGSALATSRGRTITVNAGAGEKIVYVIPSSFGNPIFNIGGFEGGFIKAHTLEHTNASGHTQTYVVCMSVNAGLGSTTVIIK